MLDFDNDGDLDLVITTNNGLARLLRNDNGNQNDMLRVKTVGTRSNRDGIGAKVTVTTAGGTRLSAMVKSGSSYLSQSELPLTFGLGKPSPGKTVSVEVTWPSGRRDSVPNVNQISSSQFRKERDCRRRVPYGKRRSFRAHNSPLDDPVTLLNLSAIRT